MGATDRSSLTSRVVFFEDLSKLEVAVELIGTQELDISSIKPAFSALFSLDGTNIAKFPVSSYKVLKVSAEKTILTVEFKFMRSMLMPSLKMATPVDNYIKLMFQMNENLPLRDKKAGKNYETDKVLERLEEKYLKVSLPKALKVTKEIEIKVEEVSTKDDLKANFTA